MATALQRDPTRTLMIRLRFIQDLNRRFSRIAKSVTQFVDKEDAFGLRKGKDGGLRKALAENAGRFAFETDAEKIQSFRGWFHEQVKQNVLTVDDATKTEPWTATYVKSAYKSAAVKSYTDVRKEALSEKAEFFDGSKAEFLHQAFDAPEAVAKVQMVSTRAYHQLQGITGPMDQKISLVLSEGLAKGQNPRQLATKLNKEVVGLGKVRAARIARTEIIHAHAEGQLDSFELLGVEEVGIEAEWKTAGDSLVCPQCGAMEGKRIKVKDARGMIPLHPNCRCAWIPYVKAFDAADKTTPKGKPVPSKVKKKQLSPEQQKARAEKRAARKAEREAKKVKESKPSPKTIEVQKKQVKAITTLKDKPRDVEYATVLDYDNGKTLQKVTKGGRHSSSIDADLLTGDKRLLDLHTHPGDEGFSDADWGMMGWANIEEMNAVGKTVVYRMNKTDAFRAIPHGDRSPRVLRDTWNKILEEVETKWFEKDITIDEMTEGITHEVGQRMSEQFSIEYVVETIEDILKKVRR